jgi:hypothetical protein
MTGRAAVLLAGCTAIALGGCAESPIVESMLVVPGYYDTLTCPELVGQIAASTSRAKELAQLMQKSSANAEGPVVNALAYNTDYAKARATQKYAEDAARRKACDLTKKVEQKPTEQVPPPPRAPDMGLPTMGSSGRY